MNALNTIKFSQLQQWDIKRLVQSHFHSKLPISSLGGHIIEQNQKYYISESDQQYGILGVNNKIGIFDAYIEKGSNIHQKYKKMYDGWIAYNPYRINVGSIGIKHRKHQYEYISPAYVVFSCTSDLLPEYLFLLMKTPSFNKIIRENTTGSVRQNLSFKTLQKLRLPLPETSVQNKFVAKYNQAIAEAKTKEDQARQLENEIEKYLFKALGIYLDNRRTFTNKTLQIIRYSNLDRWDAYGTDNSFSAALKKSDYPITPIGKVFDFITRTWDKIEPTFKYVEIGSVDPLLGIVHTEEIETKKAPSRATQIIREGDLIIGTTRPYLKKFAIVDGQHDGHICSSGFQVIAPNKDTNVEFLYEYLKSSIAIAQFEFYMTGALYPAITIKDLKKILIPLPPIGIQSSIVECINEMKSRIKLLKQQAADLRTQALKDFEKEIFE